MKVKHIKAYMEAAEAFAKCSDSTRSKVGAVLVKRNRIISCGYNALPEHLNGPLEDETGVTKAEVRHAEENALRALIRSPESAQGATLFVTHSCCKNCAISVVEAGIKVVYYKHEYRLDEGLRHLRENDVLVIKYEEDQ
ncbi:putative CMP/dCMP deaminase, zinc-binding [Pseudomonas phage PAK_P1]|uniref:dCMP deaminase n=35 Tax=root TaxID=1 RepID=A0AAF0G165_9CAUD|nr:dCMP deaminase [Pseudomonas phage PAK_P1]YP_007002496.1 dCMP deaminase [Pseudomonas phage JG004]YP_008857198.1 dCMP deaminase [Pseudomonas phage PAK_P2]YP_008859368.1 dCMP deaminase [Pseudomonas phage PAK_P4]YP_009186924.1 dCMP deaminase [Pseudomonas phage C11]YP_009199973.1 dCMP deaminase [Pseudomonas phage K8]YP_009273791.1 dCMP deaminase [Pseudomonas phage K5]YP_009287436.1 dCMP deaminase [Pseudomonas phage vB_PaeM_MAG1]YP_009291206.1 dCMP deaminase [Pseudomonas phage phiMK]YP_009598